MDIIKSRELNGNRAYGFYLSVICLGMYIYKIITRTTSSNPHYYFIDVSMISYFALGPKLVDTTSSFNGFLSTILGVPSWLY